MAILFTVLATIFIAEMGDKTQLILVAMVGRYKVSQILAGTWAATAVLNLLAVGVGVALSNYLDMRIIKTIAGLAFLWFAYTTLKGDDDEEEAEHKESKLGPIAAIFGSFFIGELGDKTQLSGIALAATYTEGVFLNAVYVFWGCTLGLILADLIGLVVGLTLKAKMPTGALNVISFGIFAAFGVVNIHTAATLIFATDALQLGITIAVAIAFVALCALEIKRKHTAAH